ncbi:MAG: DNA primase [Parcubacteria group bacterium CG08_land_8_20_14_0_20_48_21]|nr:MAG: DNA primase [Parcubacteria group bacterium CG08_land_8_20_14_0_20_48_21]
MADVDDIKQRIDIVELVREYVPGLARAGTNNWKARCPFHTEKSPSFMVSADKQIFHCFGCGEGGDIFTFVMKQENVEFPEALRTLAQRAGVELTPENPQRRSEKTRLLDLLAHAAKFFEAVLAHRQTGVKARSYLDQRDVPEELRMTYRLGYAPDQWNGLSLALKKKGYTESELQRAGLSMISPKGGVYDRFRDRLIFPIKNTNGDIVGFGGRALGTDDEPSHTDAQGPKYLNSPQTPVYDKGRTIYGLYEAKQAIRDTKAAVLVEGYMDVLASVKAGVAHAVAVSGTALTPDAVRQLKRFAPMLIFSLDTDAAGAAATDRGVRIALAHGAEVRVAPVPFGKDPDECVRHDPELWRKTITDARPFMAYAFDRATHDRDVSQVAHKQQITNELLPYMAVLTDDVEREHWLQKLSVLVGVAHEALRDRLRKEKSAGTYPEKGGEIAVVQQQLSRAHVLLGLALAYPFVLDFVADHLDPETIVENSVRDIYKKLLFTYTTSIGSNPSKFLQEDFFRSLDTQVDDLKQLTLRIEKDFATFTPDAIHQTAVQLAADLAKEWIVERKAELIRKLASTPPAQQEEEIYKELNRLNRELAHLP